MSAALKKNLLLEQLQNPQTRPLAFEQVVREHQEMLYYHIRRIVIAHEDTDDVLQNTFLKAWRYLDKFRGDSSIKTWLYRIATNEALTFLNQKKKRMAEPLEGVENELRKSLNEGRYMEGTEIQMKLQQAILTLPERQRMVFNMRYFDELKYDEISTILEVTTGALKASYHHAVKKIEKHLIA